MSSAQQYVTSYRKTEIHTADQFELLLILYREAIQSLRRASLAVSQQDVEGRVHHLNRATHLIGELQAALDLSRGGEIAASLHRLYAYAIQRLWISNCRTDAGPIEEVAGLLSTLQSGWEEARAQKAASSGPESVAQGAAL